MDEEIVIFGAGGHAKVVIEAVRAAYPSARVTIADDSTGPFGKTVLGVQIAGGRAWLRERAAARIVPAFGNNDQRARLLEWLRSEGLNIETIVHPAAVVSVSAQLGGGVFVAAGAVVNAEAEIGDGAIINTSASIDHECVIGLAAHIAPGSRLCGNVRIGARTLVGAGTTIIPGVRVGDGVLIGAGSTVIRDLPDGARVAGSPARPV